MAAPAEPSDRPGPVPATIDAAACPFDVERPVMVHRWEQLTFLHWRYDAAVVQALLPSGLEVETCDGSAWVGLVPFLMRVGVPRRPSAASSSAASAYWFARFCETNVRTYVRDRAGQSGIWFFSLDAADLPGVVTARVTYRLPYFWSAMRLELSGNRVTYTCRRLWPGPGRGARSRVVVDVGERFEPGSLQPRDHFLTARWRLFSRGGTRERSARAVHPPWPLYRANAVEVDDELAVAAGLPAPVGDPLVHYSPGVTVRIGRPERAPVASTS
jgi:uncharacterized protein YqjF (DUF2071 family)